MQETSTPNLKPQKMHKATARSKVVEDNDARSRLLREALRLFAAQGFAKTSTRSIAQAAQVNISAISYYFGDKQGLYQAAYYEPMAQYSPQLAAAQITAVDASLSQALQAFFEHMFMPFEQDDDVICDCVHLYLREMVEPTDLLQTIIEQRIIPLHHALAELIARHLQLKKPDDEVSRLVFAIIAMPAQWILGYDVVQVVSPNLLQQRQATSQAVQSMTRYATALIESEMAHRAC